MRFEKPIESWQCWSKLALTAWKMAALIIRDTWVSHWTKSSRRTYRQTSVLFIVRRDTQLAFIMTILPPTALVCSVDLFAFSLVIRSIIDQKHHTNPAKNVDSYRCRNEHCTQQIDWFGCCERVHGNCVPLRPIFGLLNFFSFPAIHTRNCSIVYNVLMLLTLVRVGID